MLNKVLKFVAASLLLLPLASQAAAPEFHYEAPLTDAAGKVRSVELPWFVLAHLLQANQADLQVVNAKNEVMVSWIKPIENIALQAEERDLSFFRGDDPTQVGLLLKLEPNSNAPKLEQLALADRHYLIIQNAQTADQPFNLQSLTMQWDSNSLTQWLPKTLKVESSDDLQTWQSVATTKLPYVLKEKDLAVENRSIEFAQTVKARFLRLSGQADFAPILDALQGVTGLAPLQSQQRLSWQTVDLLSTNNPQQFQYSIPPSVAVKQWRMHLEETGTAYAGELTSRSPEERYGAKHDYYNPMSFLDYRLNSELGELRAPAQALPDWYYQSALDWRWNFTQPQPFKGKAAVELAWQPLELRFIAATDQGPFRLVYGSRDPIKPLDAALAESIQSEPFNKQVTKVELGSEQVLKALEPTSAAKPWLSYLLWLVLIAAVAMLLWMARHLWRDLNKVSG
ncbi:MAG TPA: DUF3999 family protein [Thiolinea sp.]|nr:DUF3999 family protein [Thiolinea sp.]